MFRANAESLREFSGLSEGRWEKRFAIFSGLFQESEVPRLKRKPGLGFSVEYVEVKPSK